MKEQLVQILHDKSLSREQIGSKIVSTILDKYSSGHEIPQPYDDIMTIALHVADGTDTHQNQEEYESYWCDLSDKLS